MSGVAFIPVRRSSGKGQVRLGKEWGARTDCHCRLLAKYTGQNIRVSRGGGVVGIRDKGLEYGNLTFIYVQIYPFQD